jgi:hypothetical protein
MEKQKGAPKKDASKLKKNRGISMTDAEYTELQRLAAAEKMGVSEYIIDKLKLKK